MSSDAETDESRRLRECSRGAVVDALLDLYDDGNLVPDARGIADRAGLSSLNRVA